LFLPFLPTRKYINLSVYRRQIKIKKLRVMGLLQSSLKKEKKRKEKLTLEEKDFLKYLHTYKPKKGDTGSYKYLVFAIVYGNTRRVLRIKALKKKEPYKNLIIETLIELKKLVSFECVLFDRGFYDGKFVESLKLHKIPFILRARISRTMKKEYGFYLAWKHYKDFPIGKDGKGNLVLGIDYTSGKRMKWAFITNLKFENWHTVREIYKKRWNIENIFKATDGIQLRVQTNNPTIRMFCVCLSFLFYNAWQAKQKRKSTTLLNFVMVILEKVFEMIIRFADKSIEFYRDKLRLNVPFWDRVLRSI